MIRHAKLLALAVAATALLALAPAASAFITRAPIGSFGPEGPGTCAGGSFATGAGDVIAAVGTGNTVSGSNTITNVSTSAGTFAVGMVTSSQSFPTGTTITAVGPTTLTVSTPSNSTLTGISITAGFTQLTSVSAGCGSFRAGQTISGTGISTGTTITTVGAGTLTLSRPPIAPGTGVALSATPLFDQPIGLAFDQARDRIYLDDTGPDSLHCFSAPALTPCGGAFPLAVDAAGSIFNPSFAIDNTVGSSAGNIYYAVTTAFSSGKVSAFSSTGAALGGRFPISLQQPCGSAVDSGGNIWVSECTGLSLSNRSGRIKKYDPAGSLLDTVVADTSAQGRPFAIALDSNDNLYTSTGSDGAWKYTASSGYRTATQIVSGDNFRGIAVDGTTDRVYVVGVGSGDIYVLDSAGTLLYQFGQIPGGSPGSAGVAVDESTNEVYVSDNTGNKVWVFGPPADYPNASTTLGAARNVAALRADLSATINDNGVLATNWWFEISEDGVTWRRASGSGVSDTTQGSQSGVAVTGTATGLHNNRTYHFRIATNKGPGSTDVPFGDLIFHTDTIPDAGVTLEAARNVSTASADLSATIDDNGSLPTNWKFEVSKNGGASWAARGSGATAGSQSGVAVTSTATGLDPNTLYQFRLTANKGPGTDDIVSGPLDFRTVALPPVLSLVGSFRVTDTSAYLVGAVNPNGADTKYHFEYGAQGPCDANSCSSSAEVGVGTGATAVNVSQFVSSLTPDTTYYFRLIADNLPVGSTTQGSSLTLHTRATPPPPSTDRAYEQVSPVEKNGGAAISGARFATVAYDGGAVGYCTTSLFGDPPEPMSGFCGDNVSRRGVDGWGTRAVHPFFCHTDLGGTGGANAAVTADTVFSLNLDRVAISIPELAACPIPPLDPAAPLPGKNLYLEDLISAQPTYELLAPAPAFSPIHSSRTGSVSASSKDFGHIVYTSTGQQTPDAPAGNFDKVYEWDHGALRMVSKDAVGTPLTTTSSVPDDGVNGVSAGGSRIFFQNGSPSELYLRENATTTHWVSEQECSPACSNIAAADTFLFATPDGSRALFASTARLTNTDTNPTGADLYLYTHSANPAGDTNLILLSKDNEPTGGTSADVQDVLGLSDDGNTIYFVAGGQLVAGKPTTTGPKLYRWRYNAGTPTLDYLAMLDASTDTGNWSPGGGQENRIVTPSGAYLLISTAMPLDAVADRDSGRDIYRWEELGGWTCLSCQVPGEHSAGDATIALRTGVTGGPFKARNGQRRIVMSDDGQRVFFVTVDPLLPEDTNGSVADVYEWHDGTLGLISSGRGPTDASLLGASHTASDVFFFVDERLVGWDNDSATDIYDARIGGGFPEPPPTMPPCEGDACRGAGSSAPNSVGAGTAVFQGSGNPLPRRTSRRHRCSRSERRVVRNGRTRCVKRRRKAGANRRAAR